MNLSIDEKRIAEIRERCEKATPGPWEARWLDDCFIEPKICMIPANGCYDYSKFEENSQFTAHAREDIPYLLGEIESLQAQLAAYKSAGLVPEDIKSMAEDYGRMASEEFELKERLAESQRREQAAIKDLKLIGSCVVCKHNGCPCDREDVGHETCFEWRGSPGEGVNQ